MAIGGVGNTVEVRIGANLSPTFTSAFMDAERTSKRLGDTVSNLDRELRNSRGVQKLEQNVEEASRSFQEARQELASLERRIESGEQQTDELTNSWVEAQQRVESTEREFRDLSRRLEEARQNTSEFDRSTDRLGDSQRDLQRRLEATRRAQDQYNRSMERANTLRERAGKLAMGAAGAAAAGYGMARVVAAPIRAGVEFEQAASNVKAIARDPGAFGNLEEAHAELEDRMMTLGKETAFTAEEVAQAAKFLSIAGFDVQETVDALPATLNLSIAGDLDLGATGDIMTNIMNAFGIAADESERAADVMAKAVTSANTDVRQLGDAMQYVSPVANEMGLSLEETTAGVAMLSNSGIQASKAGTAMRAMFNRLARPMGEGGAILEKLNVETMDMNGNMRNAFTIMSEMNEEMLNQGLGSGERLANLSKVFGQRAMSGAAVIMKEAEAEGKDAASALDDYLASLIEVSEGQAGFAQSVADQRLDNLAGDWEKFTGAVDEAFNRMYVTVRPMLRGIAQGLDQAATATAAWMEEHPGLTKAIMVTGMGVTALTIAAAGFLGVAAAVTAVQWLWVKATAAAALSLGSTTGKVNLLTAAQVKGNAVATATVAKMKAVAAWYTATNARVAASIPVIRTQTAAWVRHNLAASTVSARLGSVGAAAMRTGTALKGLAAAAAGIGVGGAMKALGAALLVPVASLKALAVAAWGFVVSNPLGWILGAVAAVGLAVFKYWEPISAFARGVWGGVADSLKPVIEALEPVGRLIGYVGRVLGWAIDQFWNLIAPVDASTESLSKAEKAGYAVGQMIGWLVKPFEIVANVIGWVADKIDMLIQGIGKAVDLAKSVGSFFGLGSDEDEQTSRRPGQGVLRREEQETREPDSYVKEVLPDNVFDIGEARKRREQQENAPPPMLERPEGSGSEPEPQAPEPAIPDFIKQEGVPDVVVQAPPERVVVVQGAERHEERQQRRGRPDPTTSPHSLADNRSPREVVREVATPPIVESPEQIINPPVLSREDRGRGEQPEIPNVPSEPRRARRTIQIERIDINVNAATDPEATAEAVMAQWNEEMLRTERELVD